MNAVGACMHFVLPREEVLAFASVDTALEGSADLAGELGVSVSVSSAST